MKWNLKKMKKQNEMEAQEDEDAIEEEHIGEFSTISTNYKMTCQHK